MMLAWKYPVSDTGTWTLEEALVYIRALQPAAMRAGWCILLGGGVLNNGSSGRDLDLLAYPREQGSEVTRLTTLLPKGKWCPAPSIAPVAYVYCYETRGRAVELIFQTFAVFVGQ